MKNPKTFPEDTPGAVPTKRGLLAERVGFVSGPAGRRQASNVYGLSDEAFARYLSEKGASNRQTATNVDAMGSSGISQTVTGDDDVTVRTSSKGRSDAAAANRNAATRGIKIFADNPMDQELEIRLKNLERAPRCGARTRAGTACQRPALRGRRRCRLHGGLSPGAPRGLKNGNFKNGDSTAEAIAERRWLRSLVKAFASRG
jgi:glucans biosynthesis protein